VNIGRPQSLILTEAGKSLLPLLTGALDSIEAAVARLSPGQESVALTARTSGHLSDPREA
jgi:hypothetical protein